MEKNKNPFSENKKENQPGHSQPVGKNKKERPKSAIGRWLDKLAKTNEKEFGTNGPSCCK